MVNLYRIGFIYIICGTAVALAASAEKTADAVWSDVAALAKPVPVKAVTMTGKKKTPVQLASDIELQSNQARTAAVAAKDFYIKHPGHAKAAEARKLEVLCLLRGIHGNESAQEDLAVTTARAFRDNSSTPHADRLEIALVLARVERSLKVKRTQSGGALADALKLADNLKAQFGDFPLLQSYYLELARSLDVAGAKPIATAIVNSTSSTAPTKAEAQGMLDRASLTGTPVTLRFPNLGGSEVGMIKTEAKLTVLVAWSASVAGELDEAKVFASKFPPGTQTIYLGIGLPKVTVQKLWGATDVSGVSCYATPGFESKLVVNALKLRTARLPYAFVLDRDGIVKASGELKTLPAMVEAAARQTPASSLP